MSRAEGEAFSRLAADLKRYDPALATALTRNVRKAAQPAARSAQAAIRSMPTKGGRSTGLRERVANTVTVQVRKGERRSGVSIVAKASKMPADQRTLPQAIQRNRWRHRVFGSDVWVEQEGVDWFDGPISQHADNVHTSIVAAVAEAERAAGFR